MYIQENTCRRDNRQVGRLKITKNLIFDINWFILLTVEADIYKIIRVFSLENTLSS